ncbi:hypothetical protein ABT324_24450 [Saccharopolyspora sp. NPDC000359]|uniref:hypothetical protein n=1 Tax=Saccharopolyspora sp. NPDC000359 TaxID=3154251 RepID=UPI00331DBDB0
MQHFHIEVTGKTILTLLLVLAVTAGGLALVWTLVNPGWAIGIAFGLVLLVRGLFALFKPHSE